MEKWICCGGSVGELFEMYEDIEAYIKQSKEIRQIHLRLSDPCIEIGGDSRMFRGLLSHYLKVTIPKGMKIHLCHACNNAGCSNVQHLYWGTAKENQDDSGFRQLGAKATANRAPWNKGHRGITKLSEQTRKKISDARKRVVAAKLESRGGL